MKIFHEAPIDIFYRVQRMTDGDYALVHLFESSPEYYRLFEHALEKGREVILDNSVFELGEAFDMDKYAEWIRKLSPTYYIVPDSWKNGPKTVDMFFEFIEKYPSLPGKRIGVAQGLELKDTAACYTAIEPYCDKIAFNLDGSHFWNITSRVGYTPPHCVRMSEGRYLLLHLLLLLDIINTSKPHHLLGCGVPQEMLNYQGPKWSWIDSVDTSNPVIHGLQGIRYTPEGLFQKDPTMVCNIMDMKVTDQQWHEVRYNIQKFKEFAYE